MRKVVLSLLVFLLVGACGGDSGGPTSVSANASGAFTLRTVNGQNLPFVVPGSTSTDKAEITGGFINLNRDQTYSAGLSVRLTQGNTVLTDTQTDMGIWSVTGSSITMRSSDGSSVSAAWDGGSRLTMVDEGISLVFQK